MEIKKASCSVIIPHYNIPSRLKRLLDSIPNDYFEVIVVDDKSNQCLEELEQLKQDYPSVMFVNNDTESKGAGTCRNIGLDYVSSKWVLFADSDDFFTYNVLESVKKWEDTEYEVIFFKPTSFDEKTEGISDRHIEFCSILEAYQKDSNLKNEYRLRYELVAPWSKMIRTDFLRKNEIQFENTLVANDLFFCRQLGVKANQIAVSDDVIYTIVTRDGSLTTHVDEKYFNIRLDTFIRSAKYVRDNVSKTEWKAIHMNGGYFFHICRINKYGFIKYFEIAFKMVANHIYIL